MSIAGSDSSAGAGIQADLKTFTRLGCHGLTVITSVTAQNTSRVDKVQHLSADMIYAQVKALADDIDIFAVKTGMLATAEIVEVTAKACRDFSLGNLIVDPVMVATSGDRLVDESAIRAITAQLLPRADLVTPNIFEAEILASMPIHSLSDMEKAAKKICGMGAPAVLVKGGHLKIKGRSIDVMQSSQGVRHFQTKYIPCGNVHGTGCTLSSAIAAHVALGCALSPAVKKAREFVHRGIKRAYHPGKGSGIPG